MRRLAYASSSGVHLPLRNGGPFFLPPVPLELDDDRGAVGAEVVLVGCEMWDDADIVGLGATGVEFATASLWAAEPADAGFRTPAEVKVLFC